jgi:DNA-binding NtrC family response regulator
MSKESRGRILIVDDERVVRDSLHRMFEDEGFTCRAFANGREALEGLGPGDYDIALLDIRMPGMDGMELHARLHEADPALTILIMTGFASVDTAVQSLKRGAFDYITKPADPDELLHAIGQAMEHRASLGHTPRPPDDSLHMLAHSDMVGKSTAMRRVAEAVEMVGPSDASVLITGESGTGKEVVARAIHANSPRRNMPMVSIHCGALTETLLESELFGHERGAFTGAQFRRKGKFEMGDGGTVFLDEIGDISLRTQTDLLRVLQEKEIVRVGGSQPVKVDFRCIAATNKDLTQLIKDGAFRLDLYYRLQVFEIRMPALRERREDIPLLVDYFLHKYCARNGSELPRVTPAAMEILQAHDWPGNVRELENAVERALVIAREQIEPGHFMLGRRVSMVEEAGTEPSGTGRTLDDVGRAHIERTIRECGGNLSQASRVLGVDRTTLYNKLRKYRMQPQP